jgi:hypothetical protein
MFFWKAKQVSHYGKSRQRAGKEAAIRINFARRSRGFGTLAGAVLRGVWVLVIGLCLALSGCTKQYNAYGQARQIDTIEGYEEYIRANPQDPRVKFARERIKTLRLLEAHRSGSVDPITSGNTTPGRMAGEEVEPRNVPQGPWRVTAQVPRSSTFIIDLYHGDMATVPHQLRIDQQGEQVTYTLQYGSGPGAYYLTAGVPFASFRRLWATVVASDVGSFRPSYGRMVSAADYRGNLVVEVDTGAERMSRTIRLEGLNFQDRNLRSLLQSMAEMHPGDRSMNFAR